MSEMVETAVILGVTVDEDMFFEKTGSKRVCDSGHGDQPAGATYCPRCGAVVRTQEVRRPTAAVARWADKHGKVPHLVWEALTSHTLTETDAVAIHEVSPLRPTDGSHDRSYFALGCNLLSFNPYKGPYSRKPRATSVRCNARGGEEPANHRAGRSSWRAGSHRACIRDALRHLSVRQTRVATFDAVSYASLRMTKPTLRPYQKLIIDLLLALKRDWPVLLTVPAKPRKGFVLGVRATPWRRDDAPSGPALDGLVIDEPHHRTRGDA